MKKLFIILFFLFAVSAEAAAPSRQNTYVSGTVIESADVTANEDAIFNYLQAGVSVYEDSSIYNSDINASANIQSDKLNLTAIAQSVANSGSTTLTGTFAANGTTNSIGNGGSDTLTLNVPGGMTLSAATTWTLTGALTFSGTIADLGTVTTADINGGTMDGVQVGGTTATGELIVNDSNDDADGLGSQGTSGQFLQSAGAGANPSWVSGIDLLSATAVAGTNSGDITIAANKLYIVVFEIALSGTAAEIGLRFNSDSDASSYGWAASFLNFNTAPTEGNVGDDADDDISLSGLRAMAAGHPISGNFYIDTTNKSNDGAYVWGQVKSFDNTLSNRIFFNFAGTYLIDTAVTSFEIFSTMTLTGDIYVYEFGLQ